MELALQLASDDKLRREETLRGLKDYKSTSLLTQPKRGDDLVALLPANKKGIFILGDEIMKLDTENSAKEEEVTTTKNG